MSPQKKIRVCILMNAFHPGANVLLNTIINDQNIEICGIVIKNIWATAKKKEDQGLFTAWWKWGARSGHYFILALTGLVILHFLQIWIIEVLLIGLLFSSRKYLKSTSRIAWEKNIPLYEISDVNSSETIAQIREIAPDVLLSNNFHQILSKEVLGIPKIGSINVHPGILPLYRGLLPHFWAMIRGEKRLGVTLHEIDEGVDTGNIISEKRFLLKKGESFYMAWKKTGVIGAELLKKYFEKLRFKKPIFKKKPSQKPSHVFSFPGEKEFEKFRKKKKSLFDFSDFQ